MKQDLVAIANFNKFAILHNRNSVSQDVNHGQVVRDEETSKVKFAL
jgi:hypothetical protein